MLLTRKKTGEVLDILDKTYPDAGPELDHTNEFELLIATILSAQCTDVRVNMITKDLFRYVKSPEDMIELGADRVREIIRPCGFFNQKTKALMGTSQILIDQYGSQVPGDRKALEKMPGVGRKTASVVLSTCFDQPAIAVDTHVFRVTNRIGIVKETTVEATEKVLMEKIDRDRWTKAHHLFIFHGRRRCMARNPNCPQCEIKEICQYNLGGGKQ